MRIITGKESMDERSGLVSTLSSIKIEMKSVILAVGYWHNQKEPLGDRSKNIFRILDRDETYKRIGKLLLMLYSRQYQIRVYRIAFGFASCDGKPFFWKGWGCEIGHFFWKARKFFNTILGRIAKSF